MYNSIDFQQTELEDEIRRRRRTPRFRPRSRRAITARRPTRRRIRPRHASRMRRRRRPGFRFRLRPIRPVIVPRAPRILNIRHNRDCHCFTRGKEYVRWLQASLNKVLRIDLNVDGRMNAYTRDAIRRLQRKAGLPENGLVGPDTERRIIQMARRS